MNDLEEIPRVFQSKNDQVSKPLCRHHTDESRMAWRDNKGLELFHLWFLFKVSISGGNYLAVE